TDAGDVKALIRDIADHLKREAKETNLESFLELLAGLPTLGPDVSISVVPFISKRAGLNDQLQFELKNAGTTDVELIEFKVMIPDRILEPSWPRHGVPPISNMESLMEQGELHTVATYYVTDLPIASGYSQKTQRLPRYLAGKAEVILRDF